jgi:ATP-binding cassette subfamily E protein 1
LCCAGINVFLDGMVPTENLRFRQESLTFRVTETLDRESADMKNMRYQYPAMKKALGEFHLEVEAGAFTHSEVGLV